LRLDLDPDRLLLRRRGADVDKAEDEKAKRKQGKG
jgi:hypothetical protein